MSKQESTFVVTLTHLEAKFQLQYWGLAKEDLESCMESCTQFAELAFAKSEDWRWEAYRRVGTENVLVATIVVNEESRVLVGLVE